MTLIQGFLGGRTRTARFKRSHLAARMKESNDWMNEDDYAIDLARRKNRVTSRLSLMQNWIHEEGLNNVVHYRPGTKETDNEIKTVIFAWSVEIANLAGKRLDIENTDDSRRREVLADEARKLVSKRLGKSKKLSLTRIKREPSPAARWKTAMTLATKTFDENRAKFKSTPEAITDFLCNELRATLERHYLENPWGENGFDETTKNTCYLENPNDEKQKEHRGGHIESDYSDEVNPFDNEVTR
jgi:hypothetical protein